MQSVNPVAMEADSLCLLAALANSRVIISILVISLFLLMKLEKYLFKTTTAVLSS